jgi:hypothetical protein
MKRGHCGDLGGLCHKRAVSYLCLYLDRLNETTEESQHVLSYGRDCVYAGLFCQENISFVFIPPVFLHPTVPSMPLSSQPGSLTYLSRSFT